MGNAVRRRGSHSATVPRTICLGIGVFGFSGCCSGFSSGIGVGLPLGRPTPSEISDQFVASALVPVPSDCVSGWSDSHLEIPVGSKPSTSLPLLQPPAEGAIIRLRSAPTHIVQPAHHPAGALDPFAVWLVVDAVDNVIDGQPQLVLSRIGGEAGKMFAADEA
jgi:hypothetical protein